MKTVLPWHLLTFDCTEKNWVAFESYFELLGSVFRVGCTDEVVREFQDKCIVIDEAKY